MKTEVRRPKTEDRRRNFIPHPSALILFLIVGRLCESAAAADSLWGWDGGCPVCPEHVSKQLVAQAAFARAHAHGDVVYSNKTAAANWTQADRDVAGWTALGVNVILSGAFHPQLTSAEVMPWRINFNRELLNRYCDKASPHYSARVIGIEPSNEAWYDNDNAANSNRWGWLVNRLGATHTNWSFWHGGIPGPTTNSLTKDAVTWLKSLTHLHASVRARAAPLGVKVYGPHWQSENYTDETRVAAQLGLLDAVDVFTFGCDAASPKWWTWLAPLQQIIGTKPVACTEFHLFHEPRGPSDIEHALQVQLGMKIWRALGIQCVLLHPGLADWVSTDTTDAPGGWRSMAQYIDGRPSYCLSVIQAELSAASEISKLVPAWTNAPAITVTCPTTTLPVILQSEIDALRGLSAADAAEVVNYLRLKGVTK